MVVGVRGAPEGIRCASCFLGGIRFHMQSTTVPCEKRLVSKELSGRSSAQFVSSPGQACKCPQLWNLY